MSKTIPGGIFSTGLIDNVFNDNKEAISQAILDRYVDFMNPDGGIVINNVAETGLQVIDQGGGKIAVKAGVAYDKWGQRIYLPIDDAGSAIVTGNNLTGGIDLSTNKNIKLNIDEAGVLEIDCSSEATTPSSTQVYEIAEAINKAGFGTIAFRSDGAGNPDNSGTYITIKSSTVGQNSKIAFTAPSANDATYEIFGLSESAYPHNYVGTTVGHNVPANSQAYNVIIEYLQVEHSVGNFLAGYPVGDDTAYTQVKDSYKITITQDSPVNNAHQHELLLAQVMYDGASMDITEKRGDSIMGVKWVANPGTLTADAFINNTITGAKLADNCLENRHFNTDIISFSHIQNMTYPNNANIGIGANVLHNLNFLASGNIGIGKDVLFSTTIGMQNIAIGDQAQMEASGNNNIAIGYSALFNSTGGENVAVGAGSLSANLTGNKNVGIGVNCLSTADNYSYNTAVGYNAMENIVGYNNVAIGSESLQNSNGLFNCALGVYAGKEFDGSHNVAIGYSALNSTLTDISSLTCIGSFSDSNGNYDNSIAIGYQAHINADKEAVIGNSLLEILRSGSDGGCDLGTSSKRFKDIYATNGTIQTSDENNKKDIQPSGLGLKFINQLTPVSFQWKDVERVSEERTVPDSDKKEDFVIQPELKHHRKHYGLVAQKVKEVLDEQGIDTENFAGYIHDEDTDTFGLRYIEFIAPMIKAIQELSEKVKQLENKDLPHDMPDETWLKQDIQEWMTTTGIEFVQNDSKADLIMKIKDHYGQK